jgi:RHS repeat-associated protein
VASSNTSEFTGRENDSDGLYFYRARYDHLVFSRFVSEDPIGFGGGDPNLYAYTADSPTKFTDPVPRPVVVTRNGSWAGTALKSDAMPCVRTRSGRDLCPR